MTNLRPALAALAACVLFTSLAHGGGPALATWEGAGTIVTSFNVIGGPITVADNGAVACIDADDDGDHESGRGGACIAFEDVSGDSLLVTDDEHGTDIAFQVCVDVNGDGICGLVGGGDANGDGIPDVFADNDGDGVPDGFNAPCSDRLVFSHGSGGDFSN
ncbi:MAG TPA: hypothetical protein VHH36_03895, partial [Candidatus Thermoplasmatota archaeon]|nr:hypothetical protein [Candidatus Thermoplasmatota archaeon]